MRKEISTLKSGEQIMFPITHGTVKLARRGYGVRKFTLTRDQSARSEDLRGGTHGNSEKSQPTDETEE